MTDVAEFGAAAADSDVSQAERSPEAVAESLGSSPASCSTIRLARRSSAMVPATRSAFLIARAPEAPWQMMHAPRMPSSGPPPNSSYSNRVLSRFRLAATLGPASPGRIGHEPGELFPERREQELDGPFAGLQAGRCRRSRRR